jgi:hypothetical protein
MPQNHGFTVYKVGQPFDPRVRRWDEGTMYVYQQDTHQLLIFYSNLRSFERKAVERGKAHFGLFVEGDVITLLFKIDGPGDRGIDWHDAPYSWHLVPEEARTLPPPPEAVPEGMGAAVTIFLIDAATGIIRAMRLMSFSHEFTLQLFRAIREQASRPFDKQRYMLQVLLLRERFPLPQSMMEEAAVVCHIGTDEGSARE